MTGNRLLDYVHMPHGAKGQEKELLLSYQASLVHANNLLQALLRAKEDSSLAVISKRKSRLSS